MCLTDSSVFADKWTTFHFTESIIPVNRFTETVGVSFCFWIYSENNSKSLAWILLKRFVSDGTWLRRSALFLFWEIIIKPQTERRQRAQRVSLPRRLIPGLSERFSLDWVLFSAEFMRALHKFDMLRLRHVKREMVYMAFDGSWNANNLRATQITYGIRVLAKIIFQRISYLMRFICMRSTATPGCSLNGMPCIV